MDAYLAPVAAAAGGALLSILVLVSVRLFRRVRARVSPAPDPAPQQSERPEPPSDRTLPDLAHRTLGVSLLLGFLGVLFFTMPAEGATDRGWLSPMAASALAAFLCWVFTEVRT